MDKNLKDIMTHAGVAVAMMVILLLLPPPIAVTVAVIVAWYMWELGQHVTKDPEKRGVLYWWNISRWGEQSRLEFFVPSLVAIAAVNVYVVITL